MNPPSHRAAFAVTLGGGLCGMLLNAGLALTVMTVVAWTGTVQADPKPVKEPSHEIKQILVPYDAPDQWPAGNWQPVSRDLFERFLSQRQMQSHLKPPAAGIKRMTYRAILQGDTLQNGHFDADIRLTGQQPQLMSLGSINLSVSRLHWDNTIPAVWGNTPEGSPVVSVVPGNSHLSGEWSLRGKRSAEGIEFRAVFAPALVSRLELQIPHGKQLLCGQGTVTGPIPHDGDVDGEEGFDTWIVDLGSDPVVRLSIRNQQPAARAPQLMVKPDVSYVVQQDGLQVQTTFDLNVLHSAIDSLTIAVPASMQIHAVEYGNETPLHWEQMPASVEGAEVQAHYRIQFPGAILGKARSLRVRGISPLITERTMPLPRVTVDQATFLTGEVQLRVSDPLQLDDLQLDGARQTEMLADAAATETYRFQQYQPEAEIRVRFGEPPLEKNANVILNFLPANDEWTLTADVRWEALSGSTFGSDVAVPDQWEVTDVRAAAAGTGDSIYWEVRTDDSGAKKVAVEFVQALDPQHPISVRITARRLPPASSQPQPLPVFRPLGCRDLQTLTTISHPASIYVELIPDPSFRVITLAEAAPAFQQLPLWAELSQNGSPDIVLQSDLAEFAGESVIHQTRLPVDVRGRVDVELTGERVLELITLRCIPTTEPIDRLLVYLNSESAAPVWTLVNEQNSTLDARKLPTANHADWQLPTEGELWEVLLPRLTEGEFQLQTMRTTPFDNEHRVTLVFVPMARNFSGRVTLLEQGTSAVVTPVGIVPSAIGDREPPTDGSRAPAERWRAWEYRRASDRLVLSAVGSADQTRDRGLASFRLDSVLATDVSGYHTHVARYEFEVFRPRTEFRFRLPDGCELVDVRVDGVTYRPGQKDGFAAVVLQSPSERSVVELEYRTVSSPGMMATRVDVPLPEVSQDVLEFRWAFALPPGARVIRVSDSLILQSPLPGISWTTRFFGPLGRKTASQWFDPRVYSSWTSLWRATSDDEATESAAELSIASPEKWSHFSGSGTSLPASLTITVWDDNRGEMLAVATCLFCLIVGVAVRLFKLKVRTRLAAAWIALLITLAWLAPSFFAEVFGAALAGSLIAVLLPRRLIQGMPGLQSHSSATSADESTVQNQAVAMSSICWFALLTGGIVAAASAQSSLFAQDQRSSRNDGSTATAVEKPSTATTSTDAAHPTQPSDFDVLIPVGPDRRQVAELPLVYVRQPLLQEIQRSVPRTDATPVVLFQSASYQASTFAEGDAVILARYQLAIRSIAADTRVPLPLTNANLGGENSCLVDGTAWPVFPNESGPGFQIIIPGVPQPTATVIPSAATTGNASTQPPPPSLPMTIDSAVQTIPEESSDGLAARADRFRMVTVELQLHPTTEFRGDRASIEVGIPRVAAGSLSLDFHLPSERLLKPQLSSADLASSPGSPLSEIPLENAVRIEIAWTRAAAITRSVSTATASVIAMAECSPSEGKLTATLKVVPNGEAIDAVTWELPADAIIGRVNTPNMFSPEILAPAVAGGPARLHLTFDKPQDQPFSLTIDYSVPLSNNAAGSDIPLPGHLILATADRLLPQSTTPVLKVGVCPGAGFAISSNTNKPSAEASSASSESSAKNNSAETKSRVGIPATGGTTTGRTDTGAASTGILQVPIEQFLQEWPTEKSLSAPQVAYLLSGGEKLTVQVQPLKSEREAWQDQLGNITHHRLEWTFAAEVQVRQAPTFSHLLDIDPRLKVESVSVKEADVERLVRYTQTGDRLRLILRDKTTGTQSIVVEASMALPRSGIVRLPFIRMATATISSSQLLLYHSSGLDVAIVDGENLSTIPETTADDGEKTAQPGGTLLGRFQLLDQNQSPQIRLSSRNLPLSADSARVLWKDAEQEWQLATVIQVHAAARNRFRFRIRIPEELLADYQLKPQSAWLQARSIDAGLIEFSPRPGIRLEESAVIAITAAVTPPEFGTWELPEVRVEDVTFGERLLALPPSSEFIPASVESSTGLAEALPEWVRGGLPAEGLPKAFDAYRGLTDHWQLARRNRLKTSSESVVHLLETEIWLTGSPYDTGRSVLLVEPGSGQQLRMRWPEGLVLQRLTVDGRSFRAIPQPVEGTLAISLETHSATTPVVLYWRRARSTAVPRLGEVSVAIPFPLDATVRRSFATLIPPVGLRSSTAGGLREMTRHDQISQRAEALLEVARIQQERGEPLSTKYAQALRESQKAVAGAVAGRTPDNDREDLAAVGDRSERLIAGISELLKQRQAMQPDLAAGEVLFPALPITEANVHRDLLHIRTELRSGQVELQAWFVDEWVVMGTLAFVGLCLLIPILIRLIGLDAGDWLHAHPELAWIAIATLWWLCLEGSALGLLGLVAAVVLGLQSWLRRFRPRSTAEA